MMNDEKMPMFHHSSFRIQNLISPALVDRVIHPVDYARVNPRAGQIGGRSKDVNRGPASSATTASPSEPVTQASNTKIKN